MSFLRIRNWEHYQNADVFKKSGGTPPWCKLYTRRDIDLDQACLEARLLFVELLKCASEYGNVMRGDPEWIARETRMPIAAVVKGLPVLLKGAWLSESKTPRRSRKILEALAPREEKDKDPSSVLTKSRPTQAVQRAERFVLTSGWQIQDVDLIDTLVTDYKMPSAEVKRLLELGQNLRMAKVAPDLLKVVDIDAKRGAA